MSLRNSSIAKIWAALEKSPFTVADFDVSFNDDGGNLCLIRFRHDPAYFLQVQSGGDNRARVIESPGEYRTQDLRVLESFEGVPGRIASWTRNVREELRTTLPVYAELDELRRVIDEHVKNNVKDPDAPFSPTEAETLKTALDELTRKLEELAEKNELTQQELNRLNQEIASLKANVGSYPKGTWYKTAASKLWITARCVVTSPEGRKVLTQVAGKALGLPAPPDG